MQEILNLGIGSGDLVSEIEDISVWGKSKIIITAGSLDGFCLAGLDAKQIFADLMVTVYGNADFSHMKVEWDVFLNGMDVSRNVYFTHTNVSENADFSRMKILKDAYFSGMNVSGNATFGRMYVSGNADFTHINVLGNADFGHLSSLT